MSGLSLAIALLWLRFAPCPADESIAFIAFLYFRAEVLADGTFRASTPAGPRHLHTPRAHGIASSLRMGRLISLLNACAELVKTLVSIFVSTPRIRMHKNALHTKL